MLRLISAAAAFATGRHCHIVTDSIFFAAEMFTPPTLHDAADDDTPRLPDDASLCCHGTPRCCHASRRPRADAADTLPAAAADIYTLSSPFLANIAIASPCCCYAITPRLIHIASYADADIFFSFRADAIDAT